MKSIKTAALLLSGFLALTLVFGCNEKEDEGFMDTVTTELEAQMARDLLGISNPSGGTTTSTFPCTAGETYIRYNNVSGDPETYALHTVSGCLDGGQTISASPVLSGDTTEYVCVPEGSYFPGYDDDVGIGCGGSSFLLEAGKTYTINSLVTSYQLVEDY